jgi:uncharacterized protein YqgC (DUF456 family)
MIEVGEMESGIVSLETVVLIVMVVGLFSLLTAIIPGLVIIWVAALVYGIVSGFTLTGGLILAAMTVLMVAGNLSDNLLMGASARRTGASWWSIGAALLAGLVGTIIFPPFGGLLFALLGVFTVEYLRLKDAESAWASTRSMAAGCGWAVVLRFVIGVVMIGLWVLWAFVLS